VSETLSDANNFQNGEEGRYPRARYQANYGKALPRQAGTPDVNGTEYAEMARILERARAVSWSINFEDISDGQRRKQTNPQSGIAFDLEGPDPYGPDLRRFGADAQCVRAVPRFDGRPVQADGVLQAKAHENSAEMIELYWMALMRDVHFAAYVTTGAPQGAPAEWPGGNLAQKTADDLNDAATPGGTPLHQAFLEDYPTDQASRMVTPATIFRGSARGDNVGPYISQFLLRGSTGVNASDPGNIRVVRRPDEGMVAHGTQSMNQRQRTILPFLDYMQDPGSWLSVVDGTNDPTERDAFDDESGPLFIRNMRDLANWVHIDYLYQHFLNAALILLNELVFPDGAPAPQTALDARGGPMAPMPRFPFDPGNPYRDPRTHSRNQVGFATFGPPHVLTLLAAGRDPKSLVAGCTFRRKQRQAEQPARTGPILASIPWSSIEACSR